MLRWGMITTQEDGWHLSEPLGTQQGIPRLLQLNSIFSKACVQGQFVSDRVNGAATTDGGLEDRRGQVDLGGASKGGGAVQCGQCARYPSHKVFIIFGALIFKKTRSTKRLLHHHSFCRDAVVGGNSSGRLHLFMWSLDPSDPLILHPWEHRLLLYIHAEDKVLQSSAPLHVILRSCMFVVKRDRGTAMYSHVWKHRLLYNVQCTHMQKTNCVTIRFRQGIFLDSNIYNTLPLAKESRIYMVFSALSCLWF